MAFQVRNLDFQWSIFRGKLLVSGRVHPGRLMAGTYNHNPFLTRKMISTKPPGNYVPAVNLQACKSFCFFSDMFFSRLVVKREAATSGPSSGLGSFHLAISQDLKIFTVAPCHMEISVVQQENAAMIFC